MLDTGYLILDAGKILYQSWVEGSFQSGNPYRFCLYPVSRIQYLLDITPALPILNVQKEEDFIPNIFDWFKWKWIK